MPHDVFISHVKQDKAVADEVCATLEQRGIRCWIAPRDIPAGAEWGGNIVEAIRHARILILIFSADANSSPHIRREVEEGLKYELSIIPFRLADVEPEGSLEYYLSTVQWLDAFPPPLGPHLERLTRVSFSIVQGQIPNPADSVAVPRPVATGVVAAAPAVQPAPVQQVSMSREKFRWLPFAAGMLLYVVGFFLPAVRSVASIFFGWDCAGLALIGPWDSEGARLFAQSPGKYLLYLPVGWINPVFLITAGVMIFKPNWKGARVLRIVCLLCFLPCWFFLFVFGGDPLFQISLKPIWGFYAWMIGMLTVLFRNELQKRLFR